VEDYFSKNNSKRYYILALFYIHFYEVLPFDKNKKILQRLFPFNLNVIMLSMHILF